MTVSLPDTWLQANIPPASPRLAYASPHPSDQKPSPLAAHDREPVNGSQRATMPKKQATTTADAPHTAADDAPHTAADDAPHSAADVPQAAARLDVPEVIIVADDDPTDSDSASVAATTPEPDAPPPMSTKPAFADDLYADQEDRPMTRGPSPLPGEL